MKPLFVIYRWLIYVPYLLLSTLILGVFTLLFALLFNPKVAAKLFVVTWAKTNAAIAWMRVKTEGLHHVDPQQSYVVVSNHQSLFDIFVIYGWLDIDLKWVMKKELRKVPILGFVSQTLHHVFVDRSNRAAALASLDEAKQHIVDGTSIIFFPEGTRSKTGKLLRFRKGAFRMALDLELPILPLTIVGTRDILPSSSTALYPGTAKMIVHPPIPSTGQNVDDLLETARAMIERGLNQSQLHHS